MVASHYFSMLVIPYNGAWGGGASKPNSVMIAVGRGELLTKCAVASILVSSILCGACNLHWVVSVFGDKPIVGTHQNASLRLLGHLKWFRFLFFQVSACLGHLIVKSCASREVQARQVFGFKKRTYRPVARWWSLKMSIHQRKSMRLGPRC